VSEIVGSAVASLEEKLAARGVRIRRTDAEDDDAALVDRLLLEHVFTNLLVNAADSMPSGGEVEICVRRERGDDPGRDEQSAGMICVDFADRGMGVSPEDLPHIFEPFFTTKTDGKGTGLGLPIAARIMDAHHGGIRAVAREGGGTVFTVRLPALTAGAPRRSAAPAPAASAVSS
jgi:signal transduction histidine kinase